ncbi:hypothetical protein [Pandoraea sp.]|uniref:hypothetical protein n=1 Tax=Pandoraea sp. TaxID=1883445 RepID=UPI0035B4732D
MAAIDGITQNIAVCPITFAGTCDEALYAVIGIIIRLFPALISEKRRWINVSRDMSRQRLEVAFGKNVG